MKALFGEASSETVEGEPQGSDDGWETGYSAWMVMLLLILITVVSAGVLDGLLKPEGFAASSAYLSAGDIRVLDFLLAKMMIVVTGAILLAVVLWVGFPWSRTVFWFQKSAELAVRILPKLLVGIFLYGMIAPQLRLSDPLLMNHVEFNSVSGNFLAAFIGSLMYFGSGAGVNIVATLVRFGMHPGPAMALTLAGLGVGLPGLLAVIAVVRARILFLPISGH